MSRVATNPLVQLTLAMNNALRAVMIDGASLFVIAGSLAIVLVWGAASFTVAVGVFRWR